jgi:hypothetical protein
MGQQVVPDQMEPQVVPDQMEPQVPLAKLDQQAQQVPQAKLDQQAQQVLTLLFQVPQVPLVHLMVC